MRNPYSKNKHCECGEIIQNTSSHCYSCANKFSIAKRLKTRRSYIGKNNPNWKNGLPKCKDCGKKLSNYYTKRCISCETKRKWEFGILNIKLGIDASNYKDGRTNKKYYCVDCNKELSSYQAKRCIKCTNTKDLNPNWVGGISKLPYAFEFTKKLKEFIRGRDSYICQLCNKKGNTVHHINYNKDNCKEDNLITLCKRCNTKVNFNRDYWYTYFIYIIEKVK
jgi:hypothetical protein